jgi:hypothetical protein
MANVDRNWTTVWQRLDEVRAQVGMARTDLWSECVSRGVPIKYHSFLNYLTGAAEPKFTQIPTYNVAARIVNAELEKTGRKGQLQYIVLTTTTRP